MLQIPDYSKPRVGPGEDGAPVILEGEEKAIGESQLKTFFMNVLARFVSPANKWNSMPAV